MQHVLVHRAVEQRGGRRTDFFFAPAAE